MAAVRNSTVRNAARSPDRAPGQGRGALRIAAARATDQSESAAPPSRVRDGDVEDGGGRRTIEDLNVPIVGGNLGRLFQQGVARLVGDEREVLACLPMLLRFELALVLEPLRRCP